MASLSGMKPVVHKTTINNRHEADPDIFVLNIGLSLNWFLAILCPSDNIRNVIDNNFCFPVTDDLDKTYNEVKQRKKNNASGITCVTL